MLLYGEERRRSANRHAQERQMLDTCDEFLATHAGYCERLGMRVTATGCTEIRNRILMPAPRQCTDCPGVIMDRRLRAMRPSIDGRDRNRAQ